MITTRHIQVALIAIGLILIAWVILTPEEEDKGYYTPDNSVQFEFEKP